MAYIPMGNNFAANGLINKYSESPILPQFKDRFIVGGAKSKRNSTGDLHVFSATNSTKSSSEDKRHSLKSKSSFLMTTSAAAEKMVTDVMRGRQRVVEIPSPPESLSEDADVVAHFNPITRASRPISNVSTKSGESDHTTATSSSKPKAACSSHKHSDSEVTIEMAPAKPERMNRPEIKGTTFVDLSYQGAKPTKSFTIRSIDLLIKQNPALELELNLLKKTIREHENDIEHAKTVLEVEMHKKLWETFLKMEKLEKRLEGKTSIVNDAYDKLDEYEEKIDKAHGEINDAKQRIRDLENEVQKKDRDLDLQHREQSSTVIRLEREKRGLIEQLAILEQKMDVEKIKAKASSQTKEIALRHNDGMKKHHSFYREYFDQQDALYKSYFSKNGDPENVNAEAIEDGPIIRLSTICEDAGSPGSIKTATATLRDKYRSMLEETTGDTLRGFEFLAWLEKGFDADASVVESLDTNMQVTAEIDVLETSEDGAEENLKDDGEVAPPSWENCSR